MSKDARNPEFKERIADAHRTLTEALDKGMLTDTNVVVLRLTINIFDTLVRYGVDEETAKIEASRCIDESLK